VILTAARISKLLDDGEKDSDDPFVIIPRPRLKLEDEAGAASVDLRLGTWFVSLRQERLTHLDIDDHPPEAKLAKMHYVPFDRTYTLHPGCFVLGITLEWVRLSSDLTAYVIGRSTWGRRGLIIATATGVHPGFTGCLTLELANVGEIPIEVKPGMAICQLFIQTVDPPQPGAIDRSRFAGLRRPVLGALSSDPVAEALAAAHYGA
jgi:dCTP deaminase